MRGRLSKIRGMWVAEIIGHIGHPYQTWNEAAKALCYALKVYPVNA